MKLRKGQQVTLTYKGREIEARVLMISENQQSAMFGFDGMLGGYIGMMPALQSNPLEEIYYDLIENQPVEVKPEWSTHVPE